MEPKRPPSKLIQIKKIFEETSAYTGKEFFRALVRNLAEILELHGVWITKYDRDKNYLISQAFWLKNHFVESYEYAVPGTPCEPVLQQNEIFHIPDNVIRLFPDDPDLPPLGAVSYMGIVLKSKNGEVLGHLAALDNKPMTELPDYFALFRIFGMRAESEMVRWLSEQKLKEREARLNSLIQDSVNGIIETGIDYKITKINPSAMEFFCFAKEEDALNFDLRNWMLPKSAQTLENAVQSILTKDSLRSSRPHRNFLECRDNEGKEWRAEVTISSYRYEEKIFLVLFIVDVEEKLKAEEEIKKLTIEKDILQEEMNKIHQPNGLIGNSAPMESVHSLIQQVAPTDSTVLITGETGTGKELVARAIHNTSLRSARTMITVNCAALPAELIESELFGHVKGAFTGAISSRTGKFVMANHSTLFLDELGELPLPLQAKLLRALQEGEIQPVGSTEVLKIDVRIIAATNKDLIKAVLEGRFREDLYYRLHVFPIHLPPLRERSDDILLLANYFIQQCAIKMNRKEKLLNEYDMNKMLNYSWPGNVRELQNVIERGFIISDGDYIELDHLHSESRKEENPVSINYENRILTASDLREIEKNNILKALNFTHWQISGERGAAAMLGVPPTTLSSKIKSLGITKAYVSREK
ncbi:MAG TPA: sigma 54-interacting transcriptional regulator [Saprospiraceae bacterium]|nr:sigma 54-interacting transcriptional regulator [Saprospiraceae bacterium]